MPNLDSPPIALGVDVSILRAIALAEWAGETARRKRARDTLEKDASKWREREIMGSAAEWPAPEELEPLLNEAHGGESPVALLDARALIALAEQPDGRLVRRQDMPRSAFLDIDFLRRMPKGVGNSVRIICVSYPWHQPDHPDPSGSTLRLLAALLRWFAGNEEWQVTQKDGHQSKPTRVQCTYAVFLDFCCLHQKDAAGKRTDAEQASFDMALKGSPCISELYSHPLTFICKFTQMPDKYPEGFRFPETFPDGTVCTPNQASYHERGWCYCEASIGGLAKPSGMVLDMARFAAFAPAKTTRLQDVVVKCMGGRSPPMSPGDFSSALSSKSFTSKKADLDAVNGLYARSYELRFGQGEELNYFGVGFGDADVAVLANALNGARELTGIRLTNNRIGERGLQSLAACLREGSAPKLEWIAIGRNPGCKNKAAVAELAAARKGLQVSQGPL